MSPIPQASLLRVACTTALFQFWCLLAYEESERENEIMRERERESERQRQSTHLSHVGNFFTNVPPLSIIDSNNESTLYLSVHLHFLRLPGKNIAVAAPLASPPRLGLPGTISCAAVPSIDDTEMVLTVPLA